MVFKRLLGALGVGGPSVDTVLDPGAVRPGGTLRGQVHLQGGNADVDIEHITLELVARVEAEHEDGEQEGYVAFGRFTVGGGFRLGEGLGHSVPFEIALPWETPVTELYGQALGIVLGVRTELAVAGARDKGDLDALVVSPLPVQESILEACGQLGFGFKSADLELGRIGGTGQQLPFYQEIELTPAPQYAHALNEVEMTFLAHPGGTEVVLEADKRGGFFSAGHDAITRFTVSHDDARQQDWNAVVDGWMQRMLEHRASYGHGDAYGSGHDGHGHGMHGTHGHGHDRHGHDSHGHGDHHRSGPGMGTVVAAGAAGLAVGVVGGMVAAEVVDEVGDFFEGDDEGDEGGGDE
ncbi:sporulation protein [Streptomyces sp. p1417]|uniref:Sporulation protein n=1 Tax=Streptomyces typhae TaxID=2681492 RepID=A0A6L6WX96_9ACTN|nr:sporulation protein [Streptomyces typhae]MVO85501.1 sporulation protein [Streptomyces typhae]